jgi:uncharacterized protein
MQRSFRAVVALATLASVFAAPAMIAAAVAESSDEIFISEIHYDNTGTDVGEAVEVFGPAGTDLTGWSIVRYNGSNGLVYTTPAVETALPATIPDLGDGFGVVVETYLSNGLQNGAPDGLALVDDAGDVRQFLSYEGVFEAVDGPAAGMTSTDIGVSQNGTEPIGSSLQLAGTGSCYGDFTWQSTTAHSFGSINPGITIDDCGTTVDPGPLPDVRVTEIHYDNVGTDVGEAVEVFGPAGTDLTGWSIVRYNGSNGLVYTTPAVETALPATIPDLGDGFGVVVETYLSNGLQNGAPDGLALVDDAGEVVEFLSYEGVFEAVDGPAAGMTSTDIGVSQNGSDPIGLSLQRLPDGTWHGPVCSSFGEINDPDAPAACPVLPVEVKIHEVQGSGDASPMVGQRVIVEGIVIGDHEGPAPALRGFFVQEEDADQDADPNTSEGIFVFNHDNDDVSVGDLVRVEGTVEERFGHTQLTDFVEVTVLSSNNPLPTPTVVEFPLSAIGDLEAVEGMLVTFPQTLVISEYFNYDRFGEIVVALPADGEQRVMNPTALFGQDTQDAQDRLDLNLRSRITVDDGITAQNPLAPIHPINRQLFGADNSFRGGDEVSGLTGPLFFDFGLYRILPLDAEYDGLSGYETYVQTVAPPAPDAVGGNLTVASFNALNYFLTIDQSVWICGPSLAMECRGADDEDELVRQRTKLLNALEGTNADIVGLNEVENTPGVEPLADLVAGLNQRMGAGTYAFVAAGEDSVVGTDAIKVGLIYKPATVTPLGDPVILDDPDFLDPRASGTDRNRAAVAQTFVENASGEVFSVVVNHLKSKGSSCGPGDDHPLAGNCALTRQMSAEYLADWIATGPTGVEDDDWLIIGDLNSYDREDTIEILLDAGFTDLIATYQGPYAYSYAFDGQLGYLDYVMSSTSLTPQVTGATVWNINADEADIFDYDTSFKSPYQQSLFDPTTPYRSSDHDVVLVGLALDSGIVVDADPDMLWPPNHEMRGIALSASDGSAAAFSVAALSATSSEADAGLGDDDVPGDIVIVDGAVSLRAERYSLDGRTYTVSTVTVGNGQTYFSDVTVIVEHDRSRRAGSSG